MQISRDKKAKNQIIVLLTLTIIAYIVFVVIGMNKNNMDYLLSKRIPKLIAISLSGGAIAFSSIIFQTICNNRILTPSVLGLDSVYSFIQTIVVFAFGSTSIVMTNKNLNFILSLIGMLIISTLLYKFVFGRDNNGIMHLLLVGLILGTFLAVLHHLCK